MRFLATMGGLHIEPEMKIKSYLYAAMGLLLRYVQTRGFVMMPGRTARLSGFTDEILYLPI